MRTQKQIRDTEENARAKYLQAAEDGDVDKVRLIQDVLQLVGHIRLLEAQIEGTDPVHINPPVITLTEEGSRKLVEALKNPPKPNKALRELLSSEPRFPSKGDEV